MSISKGWRWRLANSNGNSKANSIPQVKEWNSSEYFPSVIQMELLHKGIIEDFNIGENEHRMQWVGEVDWEYTCEFSSPADWSKSQHAELLFEGLDTFATIYMNGYKIGYSDNMFLPLRVDIKDYLRTEGHPNELRILFESPIKVGTELEKKYGKRTSLLRGTRRMHIRKAQVCLLFTTQVES
jgi:beta-mannosidase